MNKIKVADLGCGTGLVGLELNSTVIYLTGVDISDQMLIQAKQKNVYDELVPMDIHNYLFSQEAHSLCAIIAADVFIYIGNLDKIFLYAKQVILKQNFYF